MDFEKYAELVMQRRNKIKELSKVHGIEIATMLHDTLMVDVGTNRQMLKTIGFDFDEPITTKDVAALCRCLSWLGVYILYSPDVKMDTLAIRLNGIIDEEVPVIWSDGTTYETVEIYK